MSRTQTPPPEACSASASADRSTAGSLDQIVHAYVQEVQPWAEQQMRWYASQPDLVTAIEVAALSQLASGKRHPHQRRIPARVLEETRDLLLAADLGSCRTFHELWARIGSRLAKTRGAGELLVYDVAHRIGAYLGLAPERVYLHAGTRGGAQALGLNRGQAYLELHELPEPLRHLSPAEIEDCLCIYKQALAGLPDEPGDTYCHE